MLKKINNKNIFRLFLLIITTIISSHYILSELSFAKGPDGISSSENNQSNNKILVCELVQYCSHPKEFQSTSTTNITNTTTPAKINDTNTINQTALTQNTNKLDTTILPNTTSNISLVITPSPDIINPLKNQDNNQVPNLINKTNTGNNNATVITGAKGKVSNTNANTNTTATATTNQNKISNNSPSSKTITPSNLQSINSKNNATTTQNATSKNIIPPNNLPINKESQIANHSSQEPNNNTLINKNTNPQSNKVGQIQQSQQSQSSSPFPWFDQLLKTLGIKK